MLRKSVCLLLCNHILVVYIAFYSKCEVNLFSVSLVSNSVFMRWKLFLTGVLFLEKQPTIESSSPEVFCKKGVLGNFAKLTGKHLWQSLFLIKLQAPPATLLKKRLWHKCFPVNFAKLLTTPFLIEHLWWLLLYNVLDFS